MREHRAGRFDSVKNWGEFAALCTEVLQAFSKDGHLYVRHDPKAVKDLLGAANEEAADAENAFFHGEEARARNYGFDEIKVLKGNIGYIGLSGINISEKSLPTTYAAFAFVANTRALVLDLRDNGGGGSEIVPVLESLFLQAKGRAVVVGQPSAGAAHRNTWYTVNGEAHVSASTGAPALPGTDKSWEGVGVQPDHVTAPGGELKFIVRKLAEGK